MDAYHRYAPALLRKCQRMLQNRQEAEDIVQGLFVDLLKQNKTDVELPYLYRAVTNRCLNFMRYGENRRRLLDQHDQLLRGPVRTPCDEQVIGMDLLGKVMERLDRKCCEALILRYFDDLSMEEIAGMVGASRKTVGKRLKKVDQAVRKITESRPGGEA